MALDTAASVSKGCFAYIGKSKRASVEDYLDGASDKSIKSRLKLYDSLWNEIHLRIDILRSDLNSKIFDNLLTFAASCHSEKRDSIKRPMGEIPTAALITGVNTPDHAVMFSTLESLLKSKVTPLVVRVMSKDCRTVAKLVSFIISQLTNVPVPDDAEYECERSMETGTESEDKSSWEASPLKLKKIFKRRQTMTMSTLVKWYKKTYCSQVPQIPSPRKKTKISASPVKNMSCKEKPVYDATLADPSIVIMLEDAEDIHPHVLQDFVSLCSTYLISLPIVLVLGIATGVTAIHQLLPLSISSLLCMEKFQAPPAWHYLTHVMDKVVMAPDLPFKLGPRIFHFLLDNFLYHDFSILNFVMGFQLGMIEHFMTNPLSLLCCTEEKIDSTVSRLTHAQLEDMRRQPVFMRYVDGLPVPFQAKMLTDDSVTKRHLTEEVKAMHLYHARIFPMLRFLHCLGSSLPKHPLGKQFRELYSVFLSEDVCLSSGYNEAFSYLKMLSCDDLRDLLGNCLETIFEAKDQVQDIRVLHEDVETFLHRLKHVLDEQEDKSAEGEEEGLGAVRMLPQRAKLHELKETLQSLSSRRKKSPYERLRDEILDSLDGHFKKHLVCPATLPLQEIFYFNNLAAIEDQIKGAPRCSTQRALSLPGKYLECPCCQCEVDAILPSMPDICIVYKLHLECGTLINLYDWLQAFVTVVESKCTDRGKKAEKKKKPSTELRARFIRAVSELQFLGFIKATRRKTDHVMRLTW